MPPSADRDLAPGQFPDLNREFYAAEPGDYFRCRLRSLLLAVADSPALDEVLKQGITYGKIGLHRKADAEPASTTVESYGSMESVNLLHHVGECMLRLYLAHADRQPCPWLELSRLRAPQEFKKRVERLRLNLSEQATIDSLATSRQVLPGHGRDRRTVGPSVAAPADGGRAVDDGGRPGPRREHGRGDARAWARNCGSAPAAGRGDAGWPGRS
jgi:hypothetical protein